MRRLKYFLFIVLFFALAFHAKADTLGQNQVFFISSDYDSQRRASITATLRKISDHAYFYVEDIYWNSVDPNMRDQIAAQVGSLAQEFDSRIYPTERQFFGSEPNPGIDNDLHVTILLAPLIQNAGGYYDTANEFPRQRAPSSNEREMVYLNILQLPDSRKIDSFLAHEFQHIISFNQKEILRNISDDTWLNELRSEYAITLLGYNDTFESSNLQRRLQSLLDTPSDSLTEWKNLPADYGQIAMFGEYLAEHWSPKVIADTLANSLAGIPNLNEALNKNGFKENFADVFTYWLIADVLNDASLDSRFGYSRSGLTSFRVSPTKVFANLTDDITLAQSDFLKDWQGTWYDITQFAPGQNNFLRITFSSPSLASFYIPYIVFKTNGSKTIAVFQPQANSGILYLGPIGSEISRVILMPIKKDRLSGFGSSETAVSLTTAFDRVKSLPAGQAIPTPQLTPASTPMPPAGPIHSVSPVNVSDNSLIRVGGDAKVYVVQGRWRRHIVSSKIFQFYQQFGFNKVQVVSPAVLNQYQESNLIRFEGGQKIYLVDKLGRKHWLKISAQQFSASSRAWDSVFPVNLPELNFYPTGPNITR